MKSLFVFFDFLGKSKLVSCGLVRLVSGKILGDFFDRRIIKFE